MCELRTLKIECCAHEKEQHIDQLESAEKSESEATLEYFFVFLNFSSHLFTVQGDGGSTVTGKLLVSLNPSDLFMRLMAAVVTGDINALVIDHKSCL
ncbi:MAG: hypothetical protein V7731_21120 [Amphritea sp.]